MNLMDSSIFEFGQVDYLKKGCLRESETTWTIVLKTI